MSGAKRGWIVAASMGAVEAMKDQGFARWNYAFRCAKQHAKNNLSSYYQAKRLSTSSAAISAQMRQKMMEEKAKKVMEFNCWGPSTTRF